jgi:DNA mismatch endonuclease (patch repair protein)
VSTSETRTNFTIGAGYLTMVDATSARMAKIRRKNTEPELKLRQALKAMGLKTHAHVSGLPGTPDLIIPDSKVAIFVHGCFWHRHRGCDKASTPKTNRRFWLAKFEANVARDRRQARKLRKAGWSVLAVWECQINKGLTKAATRVFDKDRQRNTWAHNIS